MVNDLKNFRYINTFGFEEGTSDKVVYSLVLLEIVVICIFLFTFNLTLTKKDEMRRPKPASIYPFAQTYCVFSVRILDILIVVHLFALADQCLQVYLLLLEPRDYQLQYFGKVLNDICESDSEFMLKTPLFWIQQVVILFQFGLRILYFYQALEWTMMRHLIIYQKSKRVEEICFDHNQERKF